MDDVPPPWLLEDDMNMTVGAVVAGVRALVGAVGALVGCFEATHQNRLAAVGTRVAVSALTRICYCAASVALTNGGEHVATVQLC